MGAYADLLVEVAAEMRASFKLRVELLVASIILGGAGIVSTWASIVLFVWELPTRNAIALIAAAVLLATAVLCAWLAIRGGRRGAGQTRLAQELRLDRELFDAWSQSR
jgi:uncharacterized membrane protein YraQ (UPF0718 family)